MRLIEVKQFAQGHPTGKYSNPGLEIRCYYQKEEEKEKLLIAYTIIDFKLLILSYI